MGSKNNGIRRRTPGSFSGQPVENMYDSQQGQGSIRAQQVAAMPTMQAPVSQIDPQPYSEPAAQPLLNGAPLTAEPMAQAPSAYDTLRQTYMERPAAPTAYDTARQALVNRQNPLGGNTAYDQLRKLYMTRGY